MRHQHPHYPQAARGDPPHLNARRLLAVLALAAMTTLVMAAPSDAQTPPIDEHRHSDRTPAAADGCSDGGDSPGCPDSAADISDEAEAGSLIESVEQLPPPSLLARVPDIRPDWVPDPNLFTQRTPGSNLHSCGSFYIDRVSYTQNYLGTGYTRFHVWVTWQYKYFLAGDALADILAWNALDNCIHVHGPPYRVRSWLSIKQQFLCHAQVLLSIGTGPTWDLEGTRPANSNPITWVKKRCNW